MSKNRNIADLLDANGDVKSANLDALATVATSGSYADLTNVPDVSASSLSSNFTVAAGKTVSAGDVVNFSGGEIGDNPVVNSSTDLQEDSTNDYSVANASGTIVCRPVNDNGHKVQTGVVQSNGTISWNTEVTIYSGYTSSGQTLKHLSGNKFYLCGALSGGWNGQCSSTYNNYYWFTFFSVNPTTGAITYSNTSTWSISQPAGGYGYSLSTANLSGNVVGIRRRAVNPCDGSPTEQFRYLTFTDSGNISETSTNSFNGIHGFGSWTTSILFNTEGYIYSPTGSTAKAGTWTGTGITGYNSSASFDTTYSRDLYYYRPDENSDRFLAAFINTSNQFVLNTYSVTNGAASKTSSYIVVDAGDGVSIGGITGTANAVVLGYENNSKGYVATFSLDSTTKHVTGEGIALKHNDANAAPNVYGVNNTNKFLAIYNNAASKAASRNLTVNAYATSPLNWIGVADKAGTGGDTVGVSVDGVASGFSGLTSGEKYYYDTTLYNGSVTLTPSEYFIGTAISSTAIKLNG